MKILLFAVCLLLIGTKKGRHILFKFFKKHRKMVCKILLGMLAIFSVCVAIVLIFSNLETLLILLGLWCVIIILFSFLVKKAILNPLMVKKDTSKWDFFKDGDIL